MRQIRAEAKAPRRSNVGRFSRKDAAKETTPVLTGGVAYVERKDGLYGDEYDQIQAYPYVPAAYRRWRRWPDFLFYFIEILNALWIIYRNSSIKQKTLR